MRHPNDPRNDRTRQACEWLQANSGATQQQAAKLFGVSQPSISHMLGRPRTGTTTRALLLEVYAVTEPGAWIPDEALHHIRTLIKEAIL